jgi:hypothetical protein
MTMPTTSEHSGSESTFAFPFRESWNGSKEAKSAAQILGYEPNDLIQITDSMQNKTHKEQMRNKLNLTESNYRVYRIAIERQRRVTQVKKEDLQ